MAVMTAQKLHDDETEQFRIMLMNDRELYYMFSDNNWDMKAFKYLYLGQGETHLVAMNRYGIVGILSMERNPRNKSECWMKHVSVHPDHEGHGIARALIQKAFFYCREMKLKYVSSSFTDGGQVLKPLVQRLLAKYPEVDPGYPFQDM